jgi:ferritin-like metal-binding protein YciE
LIAAAQKVEHYEMAAYGTVRAWAEQLGLSDAAALLEQTLEEEKETDAKLTQIAEAMVNAQAEEAELQDVDEEGNGRSSKVSKGKQAVRKVSGKR